jgi:CRISPR/Cas system CMR subunit Cmr6 (Cas7 group RAMP superfamily)
MPEIVIGAAAAVTDLDPDSAGFRPAANARLLLHRSCVVTGDKLDHTSISAWAVATNLGQGPAAGRSGGPLLAAVAARREKALAALERPGRIRVRRILFETRGALIVGAGSSGVRDVGIELDGTYGWPILPGSSLKGAAREYARQIELPGSEIEMLFGSEPEAEVTAPGSVTFFDALPGASGVEVTAHVLTPHTRGYRSDVGGRKGPLPPGESINPVPIPFLAIERGCFVAYLAGPEPEVFQAADLLTNAADDQGIGAKSAAGYGYLKVIAAEERELDATSAATPGRKGRRRR